MFAECLAECLVICSSCLYCIVITKRQIGYCNLKKKPCIKYQNSLFFFWINWINIGRVRGVFVLVLTKRDSSKSTFLDRLRKAQNAIFFVSDVFFSSSPLLYTVDICSQLVPSIEFPTCSRLLNVAKTKRVRLKAGSQSQRSSST